jgi:CMP-N,N'-diacetyllegionaminic acid synthase
MHQDRKICALVTARGGSKGLPRKNVLPLAGVPLIVHTIRAALRCPLLGTWHVSTEDAEIAEISRAAGADVIDRPSDLASDAAASVDVALHAVKMLAQRGIRPDILILLQPTSPLRTAEHLAACLDAFLASAATSVVSVTEAEHSPYKMFSMGSDGMLAPLFEVSTLDRPRQSLPRILRPNGAIYGIRLPAFIAARSFFVPPVMPFVMSPETSIDIDSAFDLSVASLLVPGGTSSVRGSL